MTASSVLTFCYVLRCLHLYYCCYLPVSCFRNIHMRRHHRYTLQPSAPVSARLTLSLLAAPSPPPAVWRYAANELISTRTQINSWCYQNGRPCVGLHWFHIYALAWRTMVRHISRRQRMDAFPRAWRIWRLLLVLLLVGAGFITETPFAVVAFSAWLYA